MSTIGNVAGWSAQRGNMGLDVGLATGNSVGAHSIIHLHHRRRGEGKPRTDLETIRCASLSD